MSKPKIEHDFSPHRCSTPFTLHFGKRLVVVGRPTSTSNIHIQYFHMYFYDRFTIQTKSDRPFDTSTHAKPNEVGGGRSSLSRFLPRYLLQVNSVATMMSFSSYMHVCVCVLSSTRGKYCIFVICALAPASNSPVL